MVLKFPQEICKLQIVDPESQVKGHCDIVYHSTSNLPLAGGWEPFSFSPNRSVP